MRLANRERVGGPINGMLGRQQAATIQQAAIIQQAILGQQRAKRNRPQSEAALLQEIAASMLKKIRLWHGLLSCDELIQIQHRAGDGGPGG